MLRPYLPAHLSFLVYCCGLAHHLVQRFSTAKVDIEFITSLNHIGSLPSDAWLLICLSGISLWLCIRLLNYSATFVQVINPVIARSSTFPVYYYGLLNYSTISLRDLQQSRIKFEFRKIVFPTLYASRTTRWNQPFVRMLFLSQRQQWFKDFLATYSF